MSHLESFNSKDVFELRKRNLDMNMIKWTMTMWCNYHCPYCIQNEFKTNNKFASFEELCEQATEINKVINYSKKPVRLYMIGGEVTYFNLIDIIKVIDSPMLKEINIATNLSNSLEYFLKLKNYLNSRRIKLNLYASLHESQIKDLNEFFNKAEKVATKVCLVVNDKNFNRCQELVSELTKRNIKLSIDIDRNISLDRKSVLYNEIERWATDVNSEKKTASPWMLTLTNGESEFLSNSEVRNLFNKNKCNFKDTHYCLSFPRYRDKQWFVGGCAGSHPYQGTDLSKIWDEGMTCPLDAICPICSVEVIRKIGE